MNRTLHNAANAQRILKLTADTMLLIDRKGICIDIDTHNELWFLQEEKLLDKNIFELLPEYTRERIYPVFQTVLMEQQSVSKNFKLKLGNDTYYFKCIMYPYDDMVLCQYRDITQRSNVKRLLEQANRNLHEIQKVAHIGQWAYNTQDSVFHYWGHTGILCAENVKSISINDYQQIIIEEDRNTFNEWCKRNIEGLDQESISYRVFFNGEVYYVQVQTYMRKQLPDGSFNIEGYIQNITDIQCRRNDINTLTHAINNAKESIFAAKEDGTLIFANRQFMQNHSIPETEDINQLKIYEIVADMNTQVEWQERCKHILTHGSSFIVHSPTKQNKNILAFEGVMYNVTNDAGEESYWSFSHDISERLRYEAQIKWLNRIMETTINNLPAGIIVKDINNDFRYIYRNRESYNRDLCYSDSIGKNDFDYYPQEIAEAKRKEDIEVATTGQGLHWTLEGKDKNGNLLILDKRKIRVDGDDMTSPIIISIEWDITAMELMKRELQSSKEKAELSDKLKSAFLANMSHEIRTPLNAIVGFSNLIAESDNREERKSYYDIVEANNERLLQLINEILDLSKIESGIVEFTYGPVNLHKLCKEIYDAHIFRTPPGVKLIYEPTSNEKLMISTDKNRVFQVLSNLIGNAFKFTKKGSISYGFEQKDNRILLHVTDTGTGIEPNKIGHVFERFTKLNNYAQGTGLGLSICKTIIERLNGEISVTSEVGKGTTFSFFLPYKVEQPSMKSSTLPSDAVILSNEAQLSRNSNPAINYQTSSSASEVEDISSNRPTILVTEDTDSNYNLLNAILGKKYRLFRAHDGIEAVTMFDEVQPDLILMDIKMPNLDGLEATKIIRELSATIPIIAQSAYTHGHELKDAEEAGCNDFISKPIVPIELKEIIKQWLPQT